MPILKTSTELRQHRLRTPTVRSPITAACLWPKNGENLGTLARTCDAIGASMVVPDTANATRALRRGNTIGLHNTIWAYVADPARWLTASNARIVAVELAHGATPLVDLEPATSETVLLVGHENTGVPEWALELCDGIVEIPMSGVGNSLNVAVAASLVLYKLAGLS